jgi:thiosulfate reductase cytochrome b subunit
VKKAVKYYTFHERVWHWIQAFTIIILIITGMEIQSPQSFHVLGFQLAIVTHNVFAGLLLFNAVMGLFYFLTSGMMKQYIPGESGFFIKAVLQARYYLFGIFKGEAHPMETTPEHKLNPLQKLTYLMILNVLLPLQVITGVLIWGAQRWPEAVAKIGGLAILVPIHALGSWLFLAFTIMHIYLTTTGHTPTANIKAMISGYHEEEVPDEKQEAKS